MERCPPEICEIIFAYACADGGHTGRSLALVSRSIYEVSLPTKLHSVSLHNTRQATAFADVLERSPNHLRRVHHLFIANDDAVLPAPSTGASRPGTRISSLFSRLVDSDYKRRQRETKSVLDTLSLDVTFLQAFLKIIRLTADTLKTIAISFECHFITAADTLSTEAKNLPELPALVELSINYRAPTDTAFIVAMFSMAPPLRSLTHLDLSGVNLLRYPQSIYNAIETAAPMLENLSLPFKMVDTTDVQQLFYTVDSSPPSHHATSTFPMNLKRVLLHSHASHDYRCAGEPKTLQYSPSLCKRCRALAIVHNDDRFAALSTSRYDDWLQSRERTEKQWLDRMEGGLGGWDETRGIVGYW